MNIETAPTEFTCTAEELAQAGHERQILDALYMMREQYDPDAGPRVALIEEQRLEFMIGTKSGAPQQGAWSMKEWSSPSCDSPPPRCRFVSPTEAAAAVLAQRPRGAAMRGYQRLAEETAERRAEPGTIAALVLGDNGSAGLYAVPLERVRSAEPRVKLGALHRPGADLVAAILVPDDDECERIITECEPYPCALRERRALVEELLQRGAAPIAADLAGRKTADETLEVVVIDGDEISLRSVAVAEIHRVKRDHVVWKLGVTIAVLRGAMAGFRDLLPDGAQVRPTLRCDRCVVCVSWTDALLDASMFSPGKHVADDTKSAPLAAEMRGSPICVACFEDFLAARASLEADGYPVTDEEFCAGSAASSIAGWYVERYGRPHEPLARPLGSILPAFEDEPISADKPPMIN
jgi:hypothetical protein